MMHVDKVSVTFYLIKNTSTDLSLISKQARVMGGFFFSDTHTKLPSTVVKFLYQPSDKSSIDLFTFIFHFFFLMFIPTESQREWSVTEYV